MKETEVCIRIMLDLIVGASIESLVEKYQIDPEKLHVVFQHLRNAGIKIDYADEKYSTDTIRFRRRRYRQLLPERKEKVKAQNRAYQRKRLSEPEHREKRNAAQRAAAKERYHSDPEYREKRKAAALAAFRKRQGTL